MKHVFIVLFTFLTFLSVQAQDAVNIPVTPDLEKTPGDLCSPEDKDFKEYRYPEHMAYCERNVSTSLKIQIYKVYEVALKCKHRFTVDHLVPLALGGNNAPENLWPEHVLVKKTRQMLEQELYHAVSKGQMSSQEAIQKLLEAKTQLSLDLSDVKGCG